MNKVVLLLLIAAVAGVAWLLLGEGDSGSEWDPDAQDEFGERKKSDPALLGAEGARPRPVPPPPPVKTQAEREAERREAAKWLYLHGVVVEKEGGRPIAGARVWIEAAGAPCPRLPRHAHRWIERTNLAPAPSGDEKLVGAGVPPPPASIVTDKSGRFRWIVSHWEIPPSARFDVFTHAKGFVTGVLCRPTAGDEVTIKLVRALQLAVRVTDLHQRPVEGARLTVKPAEGTQAVPGHGGVGITDREGNAEVDGLLPGEILLAVDHPEFMPQTIGPFDPAEQTAAEVLLAPAFRLTFEIRSDDGSDVENPVLLWRTDGTPPQEEVTLLKVTASGPAAQPRTEVRSEAVRIPCEHANVQLELKADGFQPWRPAPEPLPVAGGARNLIVSLVRDTSLAPLTVRFEDEHGKPVSYREMSASLDPVQPLDGQVVGAITLEGSDVLTFPSLPTGRWRFGVRSPRYAPAQFEVTLSSGQKNEHLVRLTRPARLRINFIAPERLMVRFRIMRANRLVAAFPFLETGEPAPTTGALRATGNEGALFGGLPGGTCHIEVTSPELAAGVTTVNLRPGDTTEVEIQVRRR